MRNKALYIMLRAEMGVWEGDNESFRSRGIVYACGFNPFSSEVKEAWVKLHNSATLFKMVDENLDRDCATWEGAFDIYKMAIVDLISIMHGPTVALLWRRRKDLDLIKDIQTLREMDRECK